VPTRERVKAVEAQGCVRVRGRECPPEVLREERKRKCGVGTVKMESPKANHFELAR
jgi:hypothetical protein